MRGVIRIVTETLAYYRLGKNPKWKQLFWDGTSRRTVHLLTAAATIEEDSVLKSYVMQCSHVMKGETSEEQIESLKEMLADGQECLTYWAQRCEKECPNYQHDIPPPESISLRNCAEAATTNDTCNQAYKSRRLLECEINKATGEVATTAIEDFNDEVKFTFNCSCHC